MNVKIKHENAMSLPLKHILLRRSGYRTDDNSEIAEMVNRRPSPVQILSQEILDLENTDIIDTLLMLYDFNALADNEEATNNTVKAIDDFIKEKLNTKSYHLVWLCDTAREASFYGDIKSVYAFDLKPYNLMPISDLGPEGVLIAYN